jgi:hypothetical protein
VESTESVLNNWNASTRWSVWCFSCAAKTRIQNIVLAISENSQDTLHLQQNVYQACVLSQLLYSAFDNILPRFMPSYRLAYWLGASYRELRSRQVTRLRQELVEE